MFSLNKDGSYLIFSWYYTIALKYDFDQHNEYRL